MLKRCRPFYHPGRYVLDRGAAQRLVSAIRFLEHPWHVTVRVGEHLMLNGVDVLKEVPLLRHDCSTVGGGLVALFVVPVVFTPCF